MALLYLDASTVVAAFVREAATPRVVQFLEAQGAGSLAASGWVATEFSSALGLKLRTGAIDVQLSAAAHASLKQFLPGVVMLPIGEKDFEQAASYCRRHELGLRAGDALHLAIAAGAGCTLATLDERMAKAAAEVGVPVASF